MVKKVGVCDLHLSPVPQFSLAQLYRVGVFAQSKPLEGLGEGSFVIMLFLVM